MAAFFFAARKRFGKRWNKMRGAVIKWLLEAWTMNFDGNAARAFNRRNEYE